MINDGNMLPTFFSELMMTVTVTDPDFLFLELDWRSFSYKR